MSRRWNQRLVAFLMATIASNSALAQPELGDPDKGKALAEELFARAVTMSGWDP